MIGTGGQLDRYDPKEWEKLTPSERAHRCRLMAEQAKRLAVGRLLI